MSEQETPGPRWGIEYHSSSTKGGQIAYKVWVNEGAIVDGEAIEDATKGQQAAEALMRACERSLAAKDDTAEKMEQSIEELRNNIKTARDRVRVDEAMP